MSFDLYIFDLDGTLADTRRDLATAVNEMLAVYGIGPKTVEEITSYVGDGIKTLVERSFGGVSFDAEKALSIFKKSYWNHMLETTVLYPGVSDLLSRLDGRSKAILTNKAYKFTIAIADHLGLTPCFPIIIGGDSLERKKPSTDGIEYIIKKTGIPKERAVMIGDGKNDILVARDAGIVSVWVTYGFSDRARLEEATPDYVIDRPEILLDLG